MVIGVLFLPFFFFLFVCFSPLHFYLSASSDPCFDVKCDVTFVANDCIVPSFCLNGQCQPFITRPDGSVCHSEEWGSCLKGLCIKGHPPSFAGMVIITVLFIFCFCKCVWLCRVVNE